MKFLTIVIFLFFIAKSSVAQFSLNKILNPDTTFPSTWKVDLINAGRWKVIADFTVISGTTYSMPRESFRVDNFQFFDSNVSIIPSPIDSVSFFKVIYFGEQNAFQLKLPLHLSDKKITHLLFDFKLCYLDSTNLLVERKLTPIYLESGSKNILLSKEVLATNRRAFPFWALYPNKDLKRLREFILFKKT